MRHTLRIITAAAFLCGLTAVRAQSPCPHATEFRDYNHRIIVPVKVNGHGPYAFLLDTGSQVTIFDPLLVAALHVSKDAGSAKLSGLGAAASARILIADSVELDAQTVDHLDAVVYDLTAMQPQYANARIMGILGENFLEQFNVVINHHSACIHLFHGYSPD